MAQNFFDELHEWSERKLEILRKYLDAATRILGSVGQVYYVDGFAGRGSYGRPDEAQVPGSPLQAAQLAESNDRVGRSYSLRCINVERDRGTFDELQEITEPYRKYVRNIHGEFAEKIDDILAMIADSPTICFLDPFGVNGIDWVAIQTLIQRKGFTDFWIRFDVKEVRRREGYYNSDLAGADKQYDILCNVYGIQDKHQLHKLLDGDTAEARTNNAINLYTSRLIEEFERARGTGYATEYRIGSIKDETKYHLVFATASAKGLVLASDVVYGVEENYQKELERHKLSEHTAKTGQMNFLSRLAPTEDDIFGGKVEQIKAIIWDQCKKQSFTRLEIHTRLVDNRFLHSDSFFGIIKKKHLTQALKEMEQDGRIVSRVGSRSDDKAVLQFLT